MYLKEYTKITNDGELIINSTSTSKLIKDFVEQMTDRGNTVLVYSFNPEEEPPILETENDDFFDGAHLYHSDDMDDVLLTHIIEKFLLHYPRADRINFAVRLMTTLLADSVIGDDDYAFEDDDDEYGELS